MASSIFYLFIDSQNHMWEAGKLEEHKEDELTR